MQLVLTKNGKNLINSWTKSHTAGAPTSFSNNADVDNGMNLITMTTGTVGDHNTNFLYTPDSTHHQKLIQLSGHGYIINNHSTYRSDLNVYDSLLQSEVVQTYSGNIDFGNFYKFLLHPYQTSSPLASSDDGTISLALCEDEVAVTENTTDIEGECALQDSQEIITYTQGGTIANIPFQYKGNREFVAKKILLLTSIEHSATAFPPIIIAGGLLDTPITLNYGDEITFTLNPTVIGATV